MKHWLIGKDPDAGKDWKQEERGRTEKRASVHGVSELDMMEWLNWTNSSTFFSLDRFIPTYFVLFIVTANEIYSLISFSDISLLMLRNASDFYVLILYLSILLNLLIHSSNFLIISLGFYMYSIMLSENRVLLLLFQSGFLLFLFLFWLL